jgi:hypothetical protein
MLLITFGTALTDHDVDISKVCETVRENVKMLSKESLAYYRLEASYGLMRDVQNYLIEVNKPNCYGSESKPNKQR